MVKRLGPQGRRGRAQRLRLVWRRLYLPVGLSLLVALFGAFDAVGPKWPGVGNAVAKKRGRGVPHRTFLNVKPDRSRPPPPLRCYDGPSAHAAAKAPPSLAPPIEAPPLEAPSLQAKGPAQATPEDAAVSCHPDPQSREPKVLCSDGKSWTLRSAGLILPPVLRCSTALPECCQLGFRRMHDVQLGDLLRVGAGQAPLCHMRVQDFLKNPPSQRSDWEVADRLDDELPPGLGVQAQKDCPKGQYAAMGGCHDPRLLFNALRLPALIDPNRPLVPEAKEVVERMRKEFDRSGKCPQAALSIEVLQRIYHAAALRAELVADTPLDVAPLVAPVPAASGAPTANELPVSCGYNATFQIWYQTTFHCVTQNMCFAQSHEKLAHTCVRFDRATTETGGSPYFWPMANCQNVPSCIAATGGECTGVMRLLALGQGIFLVIQEDPTGRPYYYGVLFARRRPRTAAEEAEARRARRLLLDMAKHFASEAARRELRAHLETMPE